MNFLLLQVLEENIVSFVKNELKRIQKSFRTNDPIDLEDQGEDEQVVNVKHREQMSSSRGAFLELTQQFLRRMKQDKLADSLKNSK